MKYLKPFNESIQLETRTFNKSQVSELMYEDSIYEGEELKYSVVSKEVTDTDQEKGRVTYSIVIKEESSGKFFSGELSESPWWKQAEANAEEVWRLVIPYTVTVTKYRRPNKSDITDMQLNKVLDKDDETSEEI